MENNLEQLFREYVEKNNLIHKGDTIVVGVSGGADSVCLLFLLYGLREKLKFSLSPVHVNHMIRGAAADADQEFVRELCTRLELKCTTVSCDVQELAAKTGMSVEEAGRKARYKAFAKVVARERKLLLQTTVFRGCDAKVAVAHHMDDNAETFFLNLARGSDLRGLTGMKPVMQQDGMTVLRPLLFASRAQIEEYLSEQGIEHIEDLTNLEDEYARNKIRHNVMPVLRELNAKATEHIIQAIDSLKEAEEYMNRQADRVMNDVAEETANDGEISINLAAFKALDRVIAERVIYKVIGELAGSYKDISRIHVEEVATLADKQTGKTVMLPYNLMATRNYYDIVITKLAEKKKKEERINEDAGAIDRKIYTISKMGVSYNETFITLPDRLGTLSLKLIDVNAGNRNILIEKNKYTKVFDYDKIKGSFVIGTRETGDEIAINGGNKSVNRVFIDSKVPQALRDSVLILRDESNVIWIVGHRISELYKVTGTTKKAVQITISGGRYEQD